MGFCECTVKFALFLFNLACALLGLLILGISVMAHINGRSFVTVMDGQYTITTILMMVIGALVFAIAFFGCCGAIREDTCMLTTYGVILSTILLIQVAIGIMAFVYRGKFEDTFNKAIEHTFEDKTPENMANIDSIQKNVQCCGLYGPNFWTSINLPGSCCGLASTESCDRSKAFNDGCEPKIRNIVKKLFNLLGGVALGIAAVELLCVIFAFCLSSSIKREELRAYA